MAPRDVMLRVVVIAGTMIVGLSLIALGVVTGR
jgi:hypothetical protein